MSAIVSPTLLKLSRSAAAVGVLLMAATAVHAEPETVTFSALCYTPGAAAEATFHAANGDKREEIRIPVTSLAGPFKATVSEGGMVDFFLQAEDERPAFSAKLPEESRERLLIVIVGDGKSYRANAASLPASGFTGGTTFAVNLAPLDVAILHGDNTKEAIKPGEHRLLTLPAGYSEAMLPVQIFTRKPNAGWDLRQSVRWPVDTRFRSYLILLNVKASGPIELYTVPERLSGQ